MTNSSSSYITYIAENYSFRDTTTEDSLAFREYNFQEDVKDLATKNNRYVIGLEFTAGSEIFDYVGSIDYQFGDNSSKNKSDVNASAYDSLTYSASLPWDVNRGQASRNSLTKSSQKPSVINLSNYFRRKLGLILPDDDIIVSVNAFYVPGNLSYEYNEKRISLTYTGTEILGDTSDIEDSGNYDINDWGVTISAGYALSKTLDELTFLTGFRLLGSVEHLDGLEKSDMSPNQTGFIQDVLKPSIFSVTLPVYVNYSPAEWVSVYGGLNYSYAYSYQKSKQSMDNLFRDSYSPSEMTYDFNTDTSNHGWHSYKSIYFGFELRHPSGLRAQFFFDRDITSVRDWNVSLGWVF